MPTNAEKPGEDKPSALTPEELEVLATIKEASKLYEEYLAEADLANVAKLAATHAEIAEPPPIELPVTI